MRKTYLVQTWSKDGALQNHYEVVIESAAQLNELRKFLKGKYGHVAITAATPKGGKSRA